MSWERATIAILIVALVAVIIARKNGVTINAPATSANPSGNVDVSVTGDNSSALDGPAYLIGNQLPYAFAPPVYNGLPSMVAPGGQPVNSQSPSQGAFQNCMDC